ncbi:hypothetical protein PR003_g621 [Phytophthora rubi]|uniref:Uncharacterized protein n=1 Tax=Phytophthora rubi TaxID=129364 RepID=A0A6A3P187_9STRA|nr:hypothetical protein PR002_g84 [Phytophthora rubi]KAE9051660.1 hypothetical protein PR001_g1234 [Phytophthora rubi]KAE9359639.1 hypothetical protein PR003_g621 [Phytophthora rubi]
MLAAGPSDANVALDFGRYAAPPTPPTCRNYQSLLSAVQGLMYFPNAHWYQPMAHSLYRIHEFVMANMDAVPAITHRRVLRTLHKVNQQLGAAFVHFSDDSPFWWLEFSAAIGRIDYNSASWYMALHELTVIQAPNAASPDPAPVQRARPAVAPRLAPKRHSRAYLGGDSPRRRRH